MSYYQQAGQHATGTYPYNAYPAGAYSHTVYPYPTTASYPNTYGTWQYYNYYQQQQQLNASTRAGASTPTTAQPQSTASTTATAAASTSTATSQRYNYSTYPTTAYGRESVAAAATGGATGRTSYKKQAHYRGLFTKERMWPFFDAAYRLFMCRLVRNLMYAFGDDRNPANDTVNVMEEILVEYITDVVCATQHEFKKKPLFSTSHSARLRSLRQRKRDYQWTTSDVLFHIRQMLRNWHAWRNYYSCRRLSNERVHSLTTRKAQIHRKPCRMTHDFLRSAML
jgi:transcription initiation factor TFIID subunit 13